MQMHLQECVARAQRPAIRDFEIRGQFAAFRCAVHQVSERHRDYKTSRSGTRLENFRPRLETLQMVVAIEKRGHVDGKPPVRLRPETRLVGHYVLVSELGVAKYNGFHWRARSRVIGKNRLFRASTR